MQEKKELVSFAKIATGMRDSLKELRRIINESPKDTVFIVSSPCHLLIVFAYLLGARNLVLDAGWPLSDSTRLRVRNARFFTRIRKSLISRFIDYASFTLAKIVFVESQSQVKRLTKFRFLRKKILCSYTGYNEFQKSLLIQANHSTFIDASSFTEKIILFRGKNNLESGLPFILNMAEHLEPVLTLIIVTDKLVVADTPPNVLLYQGYRSEAELDFLFKKSSLVLGQWGTTPRSQYTIPHKFFEAAYYSKPYLSPPTQALLELLPEDKGLYLSTNSPQVLASEISIIINKQDLLGRFSEEVQRVYKSKISQGRITQDFIENLKAHGL